MKRVFIFLYGAELNTFMKLKPKQDEQIICADSGILLAQKLEFTPKNLILIGDLDSVPKSALNWSKKNNFEVLKLPTNKDLTDGHLAIEYACKNYSKNVEKVIIGGVTNKLDHTLGNILPAIPFVEDGHRIKFVNKNQIIYLCDKPIELNNCKDHILSLIPLKESKIKKTEGLKWKLTNEIIKIPQSRTLRNIAVHHKVKIEISSGVLIVVESW